MIGWIVLSAFIVIADQVSKLLVIKNIGVYDSIPVIPGIIEFVYVKNTGAAFSILNHMTLFLGLVSMVFCAFVIYYVIKNKPKNKLLMLSLSLLFGGALGNAADRLLRQFVVDFIKTSFIDFPVFNVADMAITVGAAVLMLYIIKDGSRDKTEV